VPCHGPLGLLGYLHATRKEEDTIR
jgi:ssRNA-specific RNase YbeY (16S rRNA maturation enzyme)